MTTIPIQSSGVCGRVKISYMNRLSVTASHFFFFFVIVCPIFLFHLNSYYSFYKIQNYFYRLRLLFLTSFFDNKIQSRKFKINRIKLYLVRISIFSLIFDLNTKVNNFYTHNRFISNSTYTTDLSRFVLFQYSNRHVSINVY